MDRIHALKLAFKGSLFFACFLLSMLRPELLISLFTYNIFFFRVYHLVWLIAAAVLVSFLTPFNMYGIASGKIFLRYYKETGKIDQRKLSEFTRKENLGAVRSAALWLFILLIVAALFLNGMISKTGIFVFASFAYLMDEICISLWCPFRNWLVKNRCCNTCRIHNWGVLMISSIMVFIPSFWTYSLFFLSLLVFLQWEVLHYRHPERFFEFYNSNLKCINCKKKIGKCAHN
jgi:hypothetical protein